MNYTIEQGLHSADKDHTVMTGGTLKVDKKVTSPEGVKFFTYTIPLYAGTTVDTDFHKGVHSAEHLLAYKQDTGSVRNSLEEITGGQLQGKVILDISPYENSQGDFGFRITSMVRLEVEQVKELVKISVARAIDFLEKTEAEDEKDFAGIPFAQPISCGQYDFHNPERAISDLRVADIDAMDIEEDHKKTSHSFAYVCDLRFLKPKIEGADDMVMFTPELSYKISYLIETYLPEKLTGSIAIVGTFGCMTGMYLCVSSPVGDESDIGDIHEKIIEVLKEKIDISTLTEHEKIEFETLLENYEKHKNI